MYARERAGYDSAVAAAKAFGVNPNTYKSHENGTRGFRAAEAARYAKNFHVSAGWLLTGEGSGPSGESHNTDYSRSGRSEGHRGHASSEPGQRGRCRRRSRKHCRNVSFRAAALLCRSRYCSLVPSPLGASRSSIWSLRHSINLSSMAFIRETQAFKQSRVESKTCLASQNRPGNRAPFGGKSRMSVVPRIAVTGGFRVKAVIIYFTIFCLKTNAALSADFGVAIRDFPATMATQFKALRDPVRVVLDSCLAGSAGKRSVCSYKVGGYMLATAAGEIGSDQLSDLTLICTANTQLDGLRCITTYGLAIAAFVPDVQSADRGRIIKALFNGIDVGDSTQISKDGTRYILQRVMGSLWFHIEANDE